MNLPTSRYSDKPVEAKTDPGLLHRTGALVEACSGDGSRRITEQLHREGHRVNQKKGLRIMRERALPCRPRRRWVKTPNSNHAFPRYPHRIGDLPSTALNHVWVADITDIRIQTDSDGLRLPGRHPGSVLSQSHRVCPVPPHRHGVKLPGAADGN